MTGFSIPEIDGLIDGLAPEEPGNPEEDQLPSIPEGPSGARLGDFWALGPHRLVCGSALEPETYLALMASGHAQMVFTLNNESMKQFQRLFQIEREGFVTLSEIACDGYFTSRPKIRDGILCDANVRGWCGFSAHFVSCGGRFAVR